MQESVIAAQTLLNTYTNPELMGNEAADNQELHKWLVIQERVLKQKSKAHWIEAGDTNNSYFFKCLKAKDSANAISLLKDNSRKLLHKTQEIEEEVMSFYKSLLGSATDAIPAIDIPSMRLGPRLTLK